MAGKNVLMANLTDIMLLTARIVCQNSLMVKLVVCPTRFMRQNSLVVDLMNVPARVVGEDKLMMLLTLRVAGAGRFVTQAAQALSR